MLFYDLNICKYNALIKSKSKFYYVELENEKNNNKKKYKAKPIKMDQLSEVEIHIEYNNVTNLLSKYMYLYLYMYMYMYVISFWYCFSLVGYELEIKNELLNIKLLNYHNCNGEISWKYFAVIYVCYT